MIKKIIIILIILFFILLILFINKSIVKQIDNNYFNNALTYYVRLIQNKISNPYNNDQYDSINYFPVRKNIEYKDMIFFDAKDYFNYNYLDQEIKKNFIFIGHRSGLVYSFGENNLKTVKFSFNKGFRIFELDIHLTSDNKIICFHGFPKDFIKNPNNFSFSDYKEYMISTNQELCSFDKILKFANKSGSFLLLDLHSHYEKIFNHIIENYDQQLLKSLIPQITDFEQLYYFKKNNLFLGPILTSYGFNNLSTEDILNISLKFNLPAITLTRSRIDNLKNNLPIDLMIFTHPVDNLIDAVNLKIDGIDGIYTKTLDPTNFSILLKKSTDFNRKFDH